MAAPELFLLTPLREGRPQARGTAEKSAYFYSRPCGRGDVTCWRIKSLSTPFLLTPLREGRHGKFHIPLTQQEFLLTPLREGRPDGLDDALIRRCISTHAPAGGATAFSPSLSIAPANFYSRPCGRGDVQRRIVILGIRISTHAPAGGATGAAVTATKSGKFLLTPLREGRPKPYE